MFKFFKNKRVWKQLNKIETEMDFIKKAIRVYEDILKEAKKDSKDTYFVRDTETKLGDLQLDLLKLELEETRLIRQLY